MTIRKVKIKENQILYSADVTCKDGIQMIISIQFFYFLKVVLYRIEEYYIKLYTNFRSNETKKQKGAE